MSMTNLSNKPACAFDNNFDKDFEVEKNNDNNKMN